MFCLVLRPIPLAAIQVERKVWMRILEVHDQLVKESGSVEDESKKLSNTTIFSDLIDKIDGIKDDSLSQLDRSARAIKTATERGEAVAWPIYRILHGNECS